MLIALASRTAHSQTAGGRGSVQLACDDDAYPTITCTAAVFSDKTDVPLRGVSQDEVDVRLADRQDTFEGLTWQEVSEGAVPVGLILVVDFSGALGRAAERVRTGIDTFMRDLAVTDGQTPESQRDAIGILVVTGPVEIGNDPRSLPLNQTRESLATLDRNLVRNIVRQATVGQATPLYDAVYKAILMAGQAQMPRRAVVIISDGRDQGSSRTFKAEDTIMRAVNDRIPLFAIAVGTSRSEEYLRRAVFETDATFHRADDAEQLIQALGEIRRLLKTQYQLSLQARLAADNASHSLEVRVTSGNAAQAAATVITARPPVRPEIISIAVSDSAGQPVDVSQPLPKPSVRLEAQIRARAISRVEFEVNDSGNVLTARQPPFAVDLDTQSLSSGQPHKLVVRAYGVPDAPENRDQKEFAFTVAESREPVNLPAFGEVPSGRTVSTVPWLVVGGLALLVVIALVIVYVTARRRTFDATIVEAAPQSAPAVSFEPQPLGSVSSTDRTVVMSAPNSLPTSNPTIVLPPSKYRLEVLGGEQRGQQFPIGVQGVDRVRVGREPDGSPTFIRLSSPHVSRKHAEFVLENDKVYLVDLGSSSGTFHNGRKLQTSERSEVRPGDRIVFANVETEVKP
ncbi:MAG: FHA domain-containing protein [Anaerolineales bacterium]|nr:FHA domain-containing protein [Anaerolineales bacterium]